MEVPSRRLSRRTVVAGLAVSAAAITPPARAEPGRGLRAIALDCFPLFDIGQVAILSRDLVPEKGDALASLWTSTLFRYTWTTAAAELYEPFDSLADASLLFAARSLGLDLPDRTRVELLSAYSQLEVWPDVKPALARLRAAGVRLAILSNLGECVLRTNMSNAGIADAFEAVLSTDRVRRFKPAPAAYGMAMEAFGLPKTEIGFAAFGGWDAAGAGWFGYKTAWINRLNSPAESIGPRAAIETSGIEGVLALAGLT